MSDLRTRCECVVKFQRILVVLFVFIGLLDLRLSSAADVPSRAAASAEVFPLKEYALFFEGQKRRFWVYSPLTASPDSTILVLIHGDGQSYSPEPDMLKWQHFARRTFERWAEENGAVVVYPEAMGIWNDGRFLQRKSVVVPDDVGFIQTLIDFLDANYEGDREKVVVVGLKEGAVMATRLVCELPRRFQGLAILNGTLPREWPVVCPESAAVDTVYLAEVVESWSACEESCSESFWMSPLETVEFYRQLNRCRPLAESRRFYEKTRDPLSATVLSISTYTQCRSRRFVRFYKRPLSSGTRSSASVDVSEKRIVEDPASEVMSTLKDFSLRRKGI